jgi:hypothetical protein
MSPYISWMLALLGTVAAIAASVQSFLGFDKSKVKYPQFYLVLIGAALLVQIAVLGVNLWTTSRAALEAQKKAEREVAFALWAFAEKRPHALELLTKDYPYLYGYYYFKKNTPKDYGIARTYLQHSLDNNLYKAPTSYILAVITRLEAGNDAELKQARELTKYGIEYDPQYSPLYVEKALEESFAHDFTDAAVDFSKAVSKAPVHCITVNESIQPQLSANEWSRLNAVPQFQQLAKDCAASFAPASGTEPSTVPDRGAP